MVAVVVNVQNGNGASQVKKWLTAQPVIPLEHLCSSIRDTADSESHGLTALYVSFGGPITSSGMSTYQTSASFFIHSISTYEQIP